MLSVLLSKSKSLGKQYNKGEGKEDIIGDSLLSTFSNSKHFSMKVLLTSILLIVGMVIILTSVCISVLSVISFIRLSSYSNPLPNIYKAIKKGNKG